MHAHRHAYILPQSWLLNIYWHDPICNEKVSKKFHKTEYGEGGGKRRETKTYEKIQEKKLSPGDLISNHRIYRKRKGRGDRLFKNNKAISQN